MKIFFYVPKKGDQIAIKLPINTLEFFVKTIQLFVYEMLVALSLKAIDEQKASCCSCLWHFACFFMKYFHLYPQISTQMRLEPGLSFSKLFMSFSDIKIFTNLLPSKGFLTRHLSNIFLVSLVLPNNHRLPSAFLSPLRKWKFQIQQLVLINSHK